MATAGTGNSGSDDSQVTGQQWYWTALSAFPTMLRTTAPIAAPMAFGPKAASKPTVVLLIPRYSCQSARPAAMATIEPASM